MIRQLKHFCEKKFGSKAEKDSAQRKLKSSGIENYSLSTTAEHDDGNGKGVSEENEIVSITYQFAGQLQNSGHDGPVNGLCWNETGNILFSSSLDNTLRAWDEDGHVSILWKAPSQITCFTLSRHHNFILLATTEHAVLKFGLEDEQDISSAFSASAMILTISFSPNGQLVACGASNEEISIWSSVSMEQVASLKKHGDAVTTVSWSPDGKTLLSGSHDCAVFTWDCSSKSFECIQMFYEHRNSISMVRWSGCGDWVASSSHDCSICVRRCRETKSRHVLVGHDESAVYCIAWTCGSELLASGGADGCICLWRPKLGELCAKISSCSSAGGIYWIDWNPLGNFLACGSSDSEVVIWKIDSKRQGFVVKTKAVQQFHAPNSPAANSLSEQEPEQPLHEETEIQRIHFPTIICDGTEDCEALPSECDVSESSANEDLQKIEPVDSEVGDLADIDEASVKFDEIEPSSVNESFPENDSNDEKICLEADGTDELAAAVRMLLQQVENLEKENAQVREHYETKLLEKDEQLKLQQERIQELLRELEEMATENEIQQLQASGRVLEADSKYINLKTSNTQLKEELELLQQQNEALHGQLEALDAMQVAHSSVTRPEESEESNPQCDLSRNPKLTRELENLKREVNTLKELSNQSTRSLEQTNQWNSELKMLIDELLKREQKANFIHDEECQALRKEIDSMKSEMRLLSSPRKSDGLSLSQRSLGMHHVLPNLSRRTHYQRARSSSSAFSVSNSTNEKFPEDSKTGQSTHGDWVRAVGWSSDGNLLATSSHDKTICIWRSSGQFLSRLLGHNHWVVSLAWAPDNLRIASGSFDETMCIWNARTAKRLFILKNDLNGWIQSICWSPDGALLLSASSDNRVALWSSLRGELLYSISMHTDQVTCLSWKPGCFQFSSGSWDSTVRLWDVEMVIVGSGTPIVTVNELEMLGSHKGHVLCCSWCPNGRILASGGEDAVVLLHWYSACAGEENEWHGRRVTRLSGHSEQVMGVSWSSDCVTVFSASVDSTIRVWNSILATCLRVVSGHAGSITCICSHPTQPQSFLSGGIDCNALIWDLSCQNELFSKLLA